ncbi:MAG: GNAT family N-acetyltransferase [Pseudomonadales bacterium]
MNSNARLLDYQNVDDAEMMRALMNEYAVDPMGGAQALSTEILAQLPSTMASVPGAFSVLGFVESEAAGLINCLASFSTFKCKPIINIHDVVVTDKARGSGLCAIMLALVEQQAIERGCCKLTLEVLEGNQPARKAYDKFGFQSYALNPELGHALFWEKSLI